MTTLNKYINATDSFDPHAKAVTDAFCAAIDVALGNADESIMPELLAAMDRSDALCKSRHPSLPGPPQCELPA